MVGERLLGSHQAASSVCVARSDSDAGINWDDVEDLAGGPNSPRGEDIPAEVQDKLLSDYERELITEKVKKGEKKVRLQKAEGVE